MRWLECRVPPPLLLLGCALWMQWLATSWPQWSLPVPAWAVWPLAAAGLLLDALAALGFWRRHTTVNPLRPQASSVLVVDGLYRLSRNPMYLGQLCLLLAWWLWLGAWAALPGPLLFVAWLNCWQILPEERALAARFGADYHAYCRRVRRWL